MIYLHALHGFLGRGNDFDFLKDAFQHKISLFAPSLFGKFPEISWKNSLKNFGKEFNAYVRKTFPKGPHVLLGYSLGGRLALHSLLEEKTLYRAAVIVSTHFGLATAQERKKRLQEDRLLVKKLLEMPLTAFIQEWDARALFKGSPKMHREEDHFDKEALVHALTSWSLGMQNNLFQEVEALSLPLLVIAGDQDPVYRDFALSLRSKNPDREVWIAKETKHRVPWQSQEMFMDVVQNFITRVL